MTLSLLLGVFLLGLGVGALLTRFFYAGLYRRNIEAIKEQQSNPILETRASPPKPPREAA
jgi:hypothetical protein